MLLAPADRSQCEVFIYREHNDEHPLSVALFMQMSIATTGAHLLLPLQVGAKTHSEFYSAAVSAAGVNLVPAFPMKKAPTSGEAIAQFVSHHRPGHIHLLGMGIGTRRALELVKLLTHVAPECQISMDSNRLRAVTGVGRPMTITETSLRLDEPRSLWGEVDSASLEIAGVKLDYTEMISEPSYWATAADLRRIARDVRMSLLDSHRWVEDPDRFLQCACGGGDQVAWRGFVVRCAAGCIREAAILSTFSGNSLCGLYPATPQQKVGKCEGMTQESRNSET